MTNLKPEHKFDAKNTPSETLHMLVSQLIQFQAEAGAYRETFLQTSIFSYLPAFRFSYLKTQNNQFLTF